MIKSLKVTNHLNESVDIILGDPGELGFLITDITGLGPPKASINTSELASGRGTTYNSSQINERNIVITMTFYGSDIEYSRQQTYKYFTLSKPITLTITTENRTCKIEGHVESNTPVIFSQKEFTQISIICPNPYFIAAGESDENTSVFFGVNPLFEFPFSNESLTENLIEFGSIDQSHEKLIQYFGDTNVGITISIKAVGNVKNFALYNTGTRESMKIDTTKLETLTGKGMVKGDEIIITTTRASKTVVLLRDGKYTNILNTLSRFAAWLTLTKGDNTFVYAAEEGADNIVLSITHRTLYEGV